MSSKPASPARVQRTRIKGQPGMPPGSKYVGRGTRYGNPAKVAYRKETGGWHVEWHGSAAGVGMWPTEVGARRYAVELYRQHVAGDPALLEAVERELVGRDLACWCPLPEPGEPDHCHGAVLLELTNGPAFGS